MATTADAEFDVVLAGPIFFDIVFSDLDSAPAAGTEVWAQSMGTGPGGIANLAVAARRLGLRTSLASVFGDDVYGDWCWKVLGEGEGIDLSRSRQIPAWNTAVTVSIARDGDRSMVTNGLDSSVTADELLAGGVRSRAALAELTGMASTDAQQTWWKRAAADGTKIFADIGWDSSGVWDPRDLDPLSACHAFTPNSLEAMAYTRTDSPLAAARVLADRVPLVVVTCGVDGAIAIDSAAGVEVQVPAVPVHAVDATGAGDVFAASFLVGSLRDWPLAQRLAFSALCSALAVQQLGGSFAAPGWNDIAAWWQATNASGDRDLIERYAFLPEVLPTELPGESRRAEPTFRFPPGFAS